MIVDTEYRETFARAFINVCRSDTKIRRAVPKISPLSPSLPPPPPHTHTKGSHTGQLAAILKYKTPPRREKNLIRDRSASLSPDLVAADKIWGESKMNQRPPRPLPPTSHVAFISGWWMTRRAAPVAISDMETVQQPRRKIPSLSFILHL